MKKLILVGGIFAAFALGAVAYALAPALFTSEPARAADGGERIMEIALEVVENGESYGGTVQVNFENPDELPDAPADADGIFVSRDGDTLTLGTGSIEVEIEVEQVNDQEPVEAVSAVHSGPDVAVVVTDDTIVYRDTTPHPEPTRAELEAGTMTMQRTVTAGSLDDLGNNTLVQVWGHYDGDTLIADVLVYESIR